MKRTIIHVHHVRHLILSCAAALGLTVMSGCPSDGGDSGGGGAQGYGATDDGGGDSGSAIDTKPVGDSGAPDSGSTASYPEDRTNPATLTLKKNWFVSDPSDWVGQNWRMIDLFQYMPEWPEGLDDAKKYVVFYSRTCDHCEEMFHNDLAPNEALAAQVIAIEVPQSRDVMTSPDGWPMPATKVATAQLPMGMNYIITSPLTLRLEDGMVRCATEGDHTECMDLN